DDHESREDVGAPRSPAAAHERRDRDEETGDDSRRPHEPEVPFAAGGAHERAEQAVRVHGRRMERPRIRPELGDDDRDEHAERPEDHPGAGPADPHLAGTASRGSVAAGAGCASALAGFHTRNDAEIPSTSHVIGSSKNPLYASEWTKRAKKTAASDNPRAW